jgi:cytochrome c-type biogenesis protein CcmH
MVLWTSVAAMTVVAIAAVFWPLLRKGTPAPSGGDVAVYRDQLQEIDRDLTLGLISAPDAEAARIEVSRRMLSASDSYELQSADRGWSLRRAAIAGVAALLLTGGASALYLRLGAPGLAVPAVAAEKAAPDSIDRLVAQAEEHLAKNPNDARGWEVLAPVYMRLGRLGDSANAWRNVMRLAGPNADRLANLGEALTAEANGVVTEEAKDAFERSVKLDPTTVTARYYLAIAAEQDGKPTKAAELFRQLIADAPQGAHWVAQVKTALARVDGKRDGPRQTGSVAMPQIPADNSMIRGMVEGLAARLKQDGSDPEGWVRLVRSYGVLKEPDKRTAAIADARKALSGDKLAAFEKDIAALESAAPAPAASAAPDVSTAAAATPAQGALGDDPMVRGMVDRLAARLKQDGSDPDAWVRLVRSYGVLNEPDRKTAAIADARKALSGDKLAAFEKGLAALESGAEVPAAVGSSTAPAAMASASPHGQGGPADDATVRDMVDRLAARLKKDGSDVDGWIRLVRSYKVLNDTQAERSAVDDAKKAVSGDAEKLTKLETAVALIDQGKEPPPPSPGKAGPGEHNADDMIARLAARLASAGSDPEGWLMLTRSYATLQQPEKAKEAIRNARATLSGDPAKLDWFDQAVKRFKLE